MYRSSADSKYFIRYGIESFLGDVDGESKHFIQIEGIVLHSSADDDDGTICGRIRAYVLRTEDMIESSEFDIDAWAGEDELDDIARSIYTPSGSWSDEVRVSLPDVSSLDVIVIEDIFLDKTHRRMGVGLLVAEDTISTFGRGCGLAVVCPWPTEVENRDDENEAKAAHLRIGKYSQRLGFVRIPETDLWARSLEHVANRDSN